VVLPETVLELLRLYEYAPTATEIPPPYTLAPKEVEVEELDVNDDAVQLVNVLLKIVKLLLLTVVCPDILLIPNMFLKKVPKSESSLNE
jgi:hypothetical protein